MPQITPNLWFDRNGLEAAEYYVSLFPNSKIDNVSHYGESGGERAGEVLTVDFELDGMRFTIINGGPQFTFDEAVSFLVNCKDQAEVDHYWDRIVADGGEEGPCGWCKDKFGLSWQIVPDMMEQLITDPDPARANRAMEAMMGMKKLDVAALQAAADGG
jgi:predicted 3-demethylubiquinone-9 3-methyltransferase (glyoxalase superfamily)